MINYYKMLQLLEAKASDETLWKYYHYVEKNPNIDDLITLVNMIQQTYKEKNSGMVLDFLGGITHAIIPSLPKEDQQKAQEVLSKLQVHPNNDLFMRTNNYKKFNDVQEFENFILDSIEKHRASAIMDVVQNPDNHYFWQMTSDDVKQKLKNALIEEEKRLKNQPSIADLIKKHIEDNKG